MPYGYVPMLERKDAVLTVPNRLRHESLASPTRLSDIWTRGIAKTTAEAPRAKIPPTVQGPQLRDSLRALDDVLWFGSVPQYPFFPVCLSWLDRRPRRSVLTHSVKHRNVPKGFTYTSRSFRVATDLWRKPHRFPINTAISLAIRGAFQRLIEQRFR